MDKQESAKYFSVATVWQKAKTYWLNLKGYEDVIFKTLGL